MMPQTLETLSRLESTGFNRAQSEAIIAAIGQADSELATKTDLAELRVELKGKIGEVKAEMAGVKSDLKVSTATLESKITGVEAKMWRAGITIAGLAVLLNKFLDWAVK